MVSYPKNIYHLWTRAWEALKNGIIAGYPIEDVRVELIYGSYHDVDSSEMAFKIAGSMAIQEGCKRQLPN